MRGPGARGRANISPLAYRHPAQAGMTGWREERPVCIEPGQKLPFGLRPQSGSYGEAARRCALEIAEAGTRMMFERDWTMLYLGAKS